MNEGNMNWVMEEVQRALARGISVRIEGICSMEAVNASSGAQEEVTYMEDYIGDDSGKIIEISFSRVKIPKNEMHSNQ